MQLNTQVPVGKHNNRQHASPQHEVATDVKQMPIRPIIVILLLIKAEPGHLLQKWCQICNDYHLTLLLQETFHFSIRALDMSSLSGLKFIQHVMSFLLNMYLSLGENPMQTDEQYPRQLRHTGLIEPVFYCQDSRMTAADCCRPEFLKFNPLIHWGLLVMQLFISKLGYHWFGWWLNAYSAPYHQLR